MTSSKEYSNAQGKQVVDYELSTVLIYKYIKPAKFSNINTRTMWLLVWLTC